MSEILFGMKIALSVLALVGGFFLGVLGFKRSGDALDCVLDGNRRAWFLVVAWFSLSLLYGFGGALIIAYWLSVCETC